jgi:hypothetical protein
MMMVSARQNKNGEREDEPKIRLENEEQLSGSTGIIDRN